MNKQIGWDIGGAHLKAVLLDPQGELVDFQQLSCPLWQGLDQLEAAMLKMLNTFEVTSAQAQHAVTMTGELVDLFQHRDEGVIKIAQLTTAILGDEVLFYTMNDLAHKGCFVTIERVQESTKLIASANWHASAIFLAQHLANALLVDIGSTTTDIILIEDGHVQNCGLTDAERMQRDTLIYTGVVRTPVMAIAQKLQVDGKETNVAAEHFATMADVYRLTGELSNAVDIADTPDGGPKTIEASARRLARMVGYDVEDKPIEVWHELAHCCRNKQLNQIEQALKKQLNERMTIVGVGAGNFLVKDAANSLKQRYKDLASILDKQFNQDVEVCLPAYAVATLAFARRHS
jgi:probable H4MPT-linked C1 transfer pathway protein